MPGSNAKDVMDLLVLNQYFDVLQVCTIVFDIVRSTLINISVYVRTWGQLAQRNAFGCLMTHNLLDKGLCKLTPLTRDAPIV